MHPDRILWRSRSAKGPAEGTIGVKASWSLHIGHFLDAFSYHGFRTLTRDGILSITVRETKPNETQTDVVGVSDTPAARELSKTFHVLFCVLQSLQQPALLLTTTANSYHRHQNQLQQHNIPSTRVSIVKEKVILIDTEIPPIPAPPLVQGSSQRSQLHFPRRQSTNSWTERRCPSQSTSAPARTLI